MLHHFNKKCNTVIYVLATAFLPHFLLAQVRTMPLNEVVELGLANSRQLQISQAKITAAQAKTAQYRDQLVPALNYSGSYYRLSDNITPFETPLFSIPVLLNQTQNRVSLTETVFTGFRAKNTIEASVFLSNAAKFDAARDKADVKLNLIMASLNLFKLQEAKKVIETNLATARNRRTDLGNLRTQGLALDNDVLKSELAVAQLEAAKTETDNAIHAAQFSIAVLCNLPESSDIQIDSASVFNAPIELLDLSNWVGEAGNTAGVQAALERSAAAEKQVAITKGAVLPLVNVGANYYYNNPNQRQFPITDEFIGSWDFGVGVTWNLSSFYTSRHTIQESRANLVQSSVLAQQLTDAARTDIANNFYNCQTSLAKIGVSDKSLASSIENQRVTQQRYTQQVATATDLLEADAMLLQAQINVITSRIDAEAAWFKLQKSSGRL